jgi:Helix-turn-helix
MKASEWIDRAKSVKQWDSDYRTAKELGITRGGISQIRTGSTPTLSEETCVKVSEALGIDPIIILADQAMERSKSEKARSAWAGVLGRFGLGQEKTPTPSGAGVHHVAGGNGGIRTLDEALHPILP